MSDIGKVLAVRGRLLAEHSLWPLSRTIGGYGLGLTRFRGRLAGLGFER